MFDLPLEYKFVQRNSDKLNTKQYQFQYIYKFLIKDKRRTCRRKIIVEINQYSDNHFTVDFYATVSVKNKEVNPYFSKYRVTTKVGNANRIASTIMAIVGDIRKMFPDMSFAFQAATMMYENTDDANKRYRTYKEIMNRVTGTYNNPWEVFGIKENSFIFVIQKRFINNKESIIYDYGKIFKKIFQIQ